MGLRQGTKQFEKSVLLIPRSKGILLPSSDSSLLKQFVIICLNLTKRNIVYIGSTDKYISSYDFDCFADGSACDQSWYTGDDALDIFHALSSETTDFEDAVMIETASRSHVDCIVTRNQKDYKKSSIPVFNPSEFLQQLKDEET